MNDAAPSVFNAISVSQPLLLGAFGIALFVFLAASTVLVFHWRRYGRKARGVVLAEGVYFVVAAILILAALASLAAF